jgi:hypothetical protein
MAADAIVDELAAVGGLGGVVAVDRNGALALPFCTAGMYRRYVRDDIPIHTSIFDEPYRLVQAAQPRLIAQRKGSLETAAYLARYWRFESISLQRRVCKPSVPLSLGGAHRARFFAYLNGYTLASCCWSKKSAKRDGKQRARKACDSRS